LLRLHDLLAAAHRLPLTPVVASQRAFMRDRVAGADLVVFTGTYQNAELIRAQIRPEQVFVYLGGGVNPLVVAPGADLARAVRDATEIRLLNSGQDCLAPDLFIVHQPHLDLFVERLVTRLAGLRYGPLADPAADYGPMVYDSALEQAVLHLLRHEGQLVHGGHVDVRQRRIEPAVVVGELTGKVGHTELFAPVFHVVGYRDEEALARTLTTGRFAERALGASVYGVAPRLLAALAERHTVTVNESLLAIDNGNAPFGGRGPMANYVAYAGRVHPEPVLLSKVAADHLPGHVTAPLVTP
jgi:aldehyde dehydrogenase (NAD+)